MPVLPKNTTPTASGRPRTKPYTVRWTVNGKQSEKSFRTKREADDFWASIEHQKRDLSYIDPKLGDVPFREYSERWLKLSEAQGKAANSVRLYDNALRLHVNPVIGDVAIRKLSYGQIEELLLIDLPAKGLSRSSVETCRLVIASTLSKAVKDRLIPSSPADGIRLPRESSAAKFYSASHAEIEKLCQNMPEDWRLAVWLMAGSGLRVAEALAVKGEDIRGNYIRVQRQMIERHRIGPLKHRKQGDFRDVPLPASVAAMIPDGWQGYLFTRRATDSFRNAFMRAAAKAGLPESFTPHSLRHRFASIGLANNIPLTDMAGYLGHSNVQVTYSTYRHFLPSKMDTAATVLDNCL